jgi:HK97 family phage major capsid protein
MSTANTTDKRDSAQPASLPTGLLGNAARFLLVERSAIDEAARTVQLAFASETPVERFYGQEVLDCSARSMRSSRLNSAAPLLLDHNMTDQIGVVESISIGSDKVARAVVRFGKSARADEIFRDVADGIRQNVSVGYIIHEAKLDSTSSADGDVYRVVDWEPYEISIVSVPADTSVGVGRSAAALVAPATQNQQPNQQLKEREMNIDTTQSIAATAPAAAPVITVDSRNHAVDISKIAASIPGAQEVAMRSIQAGHTTEQFQTELIRTMASKPVPTADIGLTAKETQRYSVVRAINALSSNDAASQRAAAFEREVSDAVAQKTGKAARGFYVPSEVQKRDLLVGTPTAGGNTVATNLQSGSFIEALRHAMVIDKLGAVFLSGLVGNIAIPKQTGASTAYWVAENTAPTESQQAIGQITMSPKTIGAFTDISRKLLLQSSIDVESFVQTDLGKVMGLGIQQAAINGTGAANQPSGIMSLVAATSLGANGAALDWAKVVALETLVAAANADVGSMGYLTNAKVRGALKTTFMDSPGSGMRIWQTGDSTPVNGYAATVTNAIPSNTTKGTGTNLSTIMFGNFSDLVIGQWGTLDLMVDPYTGSTAGTVRVVVLQDVDIALRRTESFAYYSDVIAA